MEHGIGILFIFAFAKELIPYLFSTFIILIINIPKMENLRGVLWRTENALTPVFSLANSTMQPNPSNGYVHVLSSESLSLGSVMEVIDQRGNIDNTKLSNDALELLGTFEQLQQQMNSLWLETIGKGIVDLDSAQWETASYWAMQCPYLYGPGVFTARSILAYHTDYSYNDPALCLEVGMQYLQGHDKPRPEAKYALMPNPASSYAMLTSSEPIDSECELLVLDMLGKPVLSVIVAKGSSLVDIDLSKLVPAVYSVVLKNQYKTLDTFKIVIIRE